VSDLAKPAQATGADKPKPTPLSLLWQRFVRFGMTPVVMSLYRLRLLGWLTDHWLTVVTHVGRKSGRVRWTVLYVQSYDPQTREVKVVSAWGESDWFKNVRKSPALQVEIGREGYPPEQRFLEAEEIAELERQFRHRNPLVARVQCWLMGWPWRATEEEFLEYACSLRGVSFRPRGGLRRGTD
jgi:deazaflavin-dependent oxidoreductase (nitroreductase family)